MPPLRFLRFLRFYDKGTSPAIVRSVRFPNKKGTEEPSRSLFRRGGGRLFYHENNTPRRHIMGSFLSKSQLWKESPAQ